MPSEEMMPTEENAVDPKACKELHLLKAQQWVYFSGRHTGRLNSAWLSSVVGVHVSGAGQPPGWKRGCLLATTS